jgi:hypothetical protein
MTNSKTQLGKLLEIIPKIKLAGPSEGGKILTCKSNEEMSDL